MFRWLASKTGLLLGDIREMATYWTTIGVMFVPIGMATLIQWPTSPLGFVLIIAGVVLGVVGLRFAIRDEQTRRKELNEAEERRARDDKRRRREHYLYILTQFEMLKSLGGKPRIVSMKYRRWLENELAKEEQKEDDDDL